MNPPKLKTLKFDKRIMLFCLLLIVWSDIGLTYFGLLKLKEKDPNAWMSTEVSMTVGPLIRNIGLESGLLVGGIINSLLILFIAIAFPIEFTYGVMTGIFTLALAINFRLLFM